MADIPVLSNGVRRRVYILDTNVLLHDPSPIFRFQHELAAPLLRISFIHHMHHAINQPDLWNVHRGDFSPSHDR